ncbi:MAG: DUF5082 domain-containing protein [Firmicutes bacterium]|nr:DUF5082 domain-containing protein [Bacillota bacterium]
MIKLKNFYITEEDGKSRLIQPVEVDETNFDVYVEVENQHQKYFVTDRADAILIGIVHMAMRQNHDIYSELPITGELLYNLNNILIPMLTKYDPTLTKIKINASPINEPVQNFGGVGTGLSIGADGLTTITQYHNHPIESMRLTHFLCFSNGAFGGYFQESGWDLQASLIYEKDLNLAKDLGLPVIMVNTNLSKLVRLKTDLWGNFLSSHYIFSVGKLFQKYYYSSSAWDYSQFMLYTTGNFDSDHYSLLFNKCVNTNKNVTILSGGGELTRFEKMVMISKNPLAKKYLHSCLMQAFNCGQCSKCRRNLLALDALNLLDEFAEVFDIEQYRHNREEYIHYLIAARKDNLKYAYESTLEEVYSILQAREPELFENIEKQLTTANKFLELKIDKKNIQTRLNIVTTAAKSPLFVEHLKHFFAINNYKSVILYGNNEITTLLLTHQKQLQIEISHIVENTKIKKHAIPRLPMRTVDYPPTDAVIICAVNNMQNIVKKLQQRINCPIHLPTEVFAHTSPYAKFSDELAKIAELSAVLQKRDFRIEQLKTTVDGKNVRIENLKTTIDNKNVHIEQLKSTIDSNNAQSTAQIQNLNTTISQKDEEIEHLKNRISALETSTSWKLTQPLRTFKQKIVPSPV